jgi:UDP-N-acetylglucosamine:LPS N-acetylglucosamine transferase
MTEDERKETRRRYGLPPNGKVVLIFGGADGIPRGARILSNLAALKEFPIVIVCGKDQGLYQRAMEIKGKGDAGQIIIFGFVDFIRDLICISDVVVSKCGASTFKEILLLGRIPIVTDYIWEQEKGNVEFLQKHRFGFFEPDLEKLSALVTRLLHDQGLHDGITGNIARAGLRNGAPDVARWLVTHQQETT